ncbi:TetR/AcrR family transcriptional regulator [Peribacillus saganii]|uniref:TetR/AcrR family transcriptional regulator n=1 Tax=Peribacillus saganii TaxID=2303992 RepID=A0A372LQN1_9BACI|nr:TetR/AcrR family transcriptional regulator [Peribacillus saganii]RFU70508.1 TetR/AcrR family transcriptional regulator [Peribacillus saganii]
MKIDDKILNAAIDMIAKKGYKGATTKEIAEKASVSEMTLFRHFGSKKKILEAAVDRYYYSIQMKELFEQKVTWELDKDLLMVAETYHNLMKKNKNVIKIAIQEGSRVKGLLEQVNKHPRQLKELLINYFEEMNRRGLVVDSEYELQAMNFLYMSYGHFISRSFVSGESITSIAEDNIITGGVKVFVENLTPERSKAVMQ